jgi:hypothetical protein
MRVTAHPYPDLPDGKECVSSQPVTASSRIPAEDPGGSTGRVVFRMVFPRVTDQIRTGAETLARSRANH